MSTDSKKVLLEPIFVNNPIALQILGICSALAVTTSLATALVMCAALTSVTAFSNLFISFIRNHIPVAVLYGGGYNREPQFTAKLHRNTVATAKRLASEHRGL